MNRELLSKAAGDIDDHFIAEACLLVPEEPSGSSERIVHMKRKRFVTLALAAALVLALGVGAYAIVERRVQDLVISGEQETVISGEQDLLPTPGPEDSREPESKSFDPIPGGIDVISMQGFTGEPEFMAMQEWAEFMHDYDRDGQVLSSVGNNPTIWDEKYGGNGYFVYSQEMADKIDEIAEKYGLALHSGGLQVGTPDELYERFGVFCDVEDGGGYYYADGTFQCDFFTETASGMFFGFQIRRCMKGVLDTVSLNIINAEEYEQWVYTNSHGDTVLLALGPRKALILSETEQSFTLVNIMTGQESAFSREDLQTLADRFDFSIL